jgi:hypothetical protein
MQQFSLLGINFLCSQQKRWLWKIHKTNANVFITSREPLKHLAKVCSKAKNLCSILIMYSQQNHTSVGKVRQTYSASKNRKLTNIVQSSMAAPISSI